MAKLELGMVAVVIDGFLVRGYLLFGYGYIDSSGTGIRSGGDVGMHRY